MQTKVIKEFFTIADFLEEEKFLEKQHQEGWKLNQLKGISKYVFEQCPNEDFVYQLDFITDQKDEVAYLQMFSDYGWEYVMKFRSWYYFRKPRTEVTNDNYIFSDTESKVKMILKVYHRNLILLPIGSLVLPIVWLLFILPTNDMPLILVTGCMYSAIMSIITFLLIRIFGKLRKLVKKEEQVFR